MDEKFVRASATVVAKNLGYKELKDLQMDVILSFVSGKDVFAVLSTGFGKSLCYGCLPKLFDILHQTQYPSIVIVVTPLIAIMEDQASESNMCRIYM